MGDEEIYQVKCFLFYNLNTKYLFPNQLCKIRYRYITLHLFFAVNSK